MKKIQQKQQWIWWSPIHACYKEESRMQAWKRVKHENLWKYQTKQDQPCFEKTPRKIQCGKHIRKKNLPLECKKDEKGCKQKIGKWWKV